MTFQNTIVSQALRKIQNSLLHFKSLRRDLLKSHGGNCYKKQTEHGFLWSSEAETSLPGNQKEVHTHRCWVHTTLLRRFWQMYTDMELSKGSFQQCFYNFFQIQNQSFTICPGQLTWCNEQEKEAVFASTKLNSTSTSQPHFTRMGVGSYQPLRSQANRLG